MMHPFAMFLCLFGNVIPKGPTKPLQVSVEDDDEPVYSPSKEV